MQAATADAAESVPDFDLGPLSWVQVEIGVALARGLDLLAAFRATPTDPALLRQARNQIHQAVGAIQMVGLEAAVAYTDELERQLGRLEQMPAADVGSTCATIDRACRKLAIFLDEVVAGAPPVPLRLFPEYEAMQRLRGVKAAAATDLFFPEMRLSAPLPGAPLPVAPKKLAEHLVKQRRVYQNGLLAFLRGDAGGAKKMREAAAGLERVSTQESARAFWWTVGAFFEALVGGGLDAGFGAKQLAARLDLQIRRVVEGSLKVATRLRREVLYYVAVSAPVTPTVEAVQKGYRLAGLIPSAEALNADLVRLQPILREVREELGTAKNIWLRVTLGRADSLPKLRETLQAVHGNAVAIGNAALTDLTAALVACVDTIPESGEVPEVLAMEYATGILLAESAVTSVRQPRQQFPEAGRGDADAARGGARIAPDSRRHRRAHRRDLSPRAGARAARAGRPRDSGEPAARRAGAGRVLPRHDEARRHRDARQGPPSDPRRAHDAGAGRCRAAARPLPGEDRELRKPGYAGRRGRPRAPRRVAVRHGILRRGARAATFGSQALHRSAPRASISARRRPSRKSAAPRPSRTRSRTCAASCPSSSPRSGARRRTPRPARR